MNKSMLTRILVGLILALLFVGLWFIGGLSAYGMQIYMAVFSIVNVLCIYEMTTVIKSAGYKPSIYPLAVMAALSPIFAYNALFSNSVWLFTFTYVCMLITVLSRIFNKDGRNEDMIAGLFMYLYPIAPLICLFKVCTMGNVALSRLSMLTVFACPLIGDTFAYFFGVFFGKRKLCEHISPKKTVAGSIGGIIGGGLGGLAVYSLQNIIMKVFNASFAPVSLMHMIAIGLILGILGQIGDLFASCIKRWAGVKDYGNIFPGHGGMLDRIDSVIMCAPLVFTVFSLL